MVGIISRTTLLKITHQDLWVFAAQLITCPVCRQNAEIAGPDDKLVIPAQAIYLAAFERHQHKFFRPDAPVTIQVLREVQDSLVGYGWRIQLGLIDRIHCGHLYIDVRDLIGRDRARKLPPVPGFEEYKGPKTSEQTVGGLVSYLRFVETLVDRNIRFDRLLNFAGMYDDFNGIYDPDDLVTVQQVLEVMRESLSVLENDAERRRIRARLVLPSNRDAISGMIDDDPSGNMPQ